MAIEVCGKPIVWYVFDEQGTRLRYKRDTFGTISDRLGTSEYLSI